MKRTFFSMYLAVILALCLSSCSTYRGVGHVADVKVGVPKRKPFHHDKLVVHSNYCAAFNKKRLQPSWVAWTLTADELEKNVNRSNNFQPDKLLKDKHRVVKRDYSYSGYDRGHLCPSADNRFSQQAMDECFLMSNMCPQKHELNGGAWDTLERYCRKWAESEGEVLIVAGPIFCSKRPLTIGDAHKVAVPDSFFKVVFFPKTEEAIGFIFGNSTDRQTVAGAVRSVDYIERRSGFNFFPKLPRKKQKVTERMTAVSVWPDK